MLGKLVQWGVIAFIVLWIVKNPASAGQTVHGWASGLLTFAGSLGGH